MIIKTFDCFDEKLKIIWYDCYQNSNSSIFQHYKWMLQWYICFKESLDVKLCIKVLYRKGDVIGILPFCINTKNNFTFLEWIGTGVSDYLYPIIKNNQNVTKDEYNTIFEELLKNNKKIDLINLVNLPQSADELKNDIITYFNCEFVNSAHEIKINSDFSEFTSNNKSILKSIKDLKRLENKLGKIDKISYFEHDEKDCKILATNKMIEFKRKQYEATGAKNIFKKATYRNFYLSLLSHEDLKKNIHISSILLGKEMIAVHYGLQDNHKYYYLMPAFNKSWNKFSPGGILMKKIIEQSFYRKLLSFDFLSGNENYKLKWSNSKIDIYNYIMPISYKGYFLFFLMKLKKFLKKRLFIRNFIYFLRIQFSAFKNL